MFPVGVEFSKLFSGLNPVIYIVISLGSALLLFFSSFKFLLVLQLSSYKGGKYFKWLKNPQTPYLSRLMLLCFLGLLFFCVLSACFSTLLGNAVSSYVGFVSFILFTLLYVNTESKVNAKVPLKKTKRLIRLGIVYLIVLVCFIFGLTVLLDYIANLIGDNVVGILRYCPICITPILVPYILYFSSLIVAPFEYAVKSHYIKITKNKLNNSKVIKIGITGSYGKTSVKEILKSILSQKYRVLATPESYNTPMGISLTASRLDNTFDIFIAEMGARQKGDIKELADIVKPNIGVLTGINEQHLESFKSIENILDTKFELFLGLTEGGMGFFSSDSPNSLLLCDKFDGEKYTAGISGEDNICFATDIVTGDKGTSFTLNFKGGKAEKCSTVLLGKHSIGNICLASSVAYKLGMTPKEIKEGINRITSIGHRLELMPNNKGIIIIDDSYNSNLNGANSALEVLSSFKGRKIVVTPGLVELGKIENVANFNFGKALSKVADKVIVIGKHNAEMLVSGLLEGGMEKENIVFSKTLVKGNKELDAMLKEGDVVLFENDLPDNYN